MYTSIESALTIKNIPLNFSGRISSERFISGKPSYVRLSYDGYRSRRISKGDLEGQLKQTNLELGKYQDSLHKLEGKIAYWQLKMKQLEKFKKPNVPSVPDIPDVKLPNTDLNADIPNTNGTLPNTNINVPDINGEIPSLPDKPNIPGVNMPEMSKLDSISKLIGDLQGSLDLIGQKMDSLGQIKDQCLGKISMIDLNKPKSFLGGIDKLDLGLTTMSHGSMSNNTIPIQGLRVKGKVNRTFYDVAAGTTVPNKLMSNSVFDQVTNNSQNIFNLNQYYTVNTSRFISSAIVGIGNQEQNSISVENYYNGRELKDIFSGKSSITNLTSNLSGSLVPIKNLMVSGSVGKTFSLSDTSQRSFNEDLAYSAESKYRISRISTVLFAKYKHIGNGYDGYSQGIYNSGFTKQEYGLNSKISKRFQMQLVYVQQAFNFNNANFQGMKTRSGTLDVQWNVSRSWLIYAGYTLLDASGHDTLARGLNHLGKAGFTYTKTRKNIRMELTGLGAVSNVNRIDSNMRIITSSLHGVLDWRSLGAGLQVNYQDYQGLNLIYGSNWIIKPELLVHVGGVSLIGSMQFLKSQQFGYKTGGSLKFLFAPSENITWDLTIAKWLPTESLYIPYFNTNRFIPYYVDMKMRIFLNRNKR